MSDAADPLLTETVDRMLTELCDARRVNAAEDGVWPHELWQALEDAALPRAWVAESLGGPGTSLADGFAVARAAAAHAAPVPLAETLLAGWLLSEAGIAAPSGCLSVAPVQPGNAIAYAPERGLHGVADRVPFAAHSAHLAVVVNAPDGYRVALVDCGQLRVEKGRSLAGESLDSVHFSDTMPVQISEVLAVDVPARLHRMGAVLRAQQMAGALTSILEQSLEYARSREQFGRPISKFQAVQHNLAVLAGEVAAAGTAADAAVLSIARHGLEHSRAFFAVAAAKIRAGQAAGSGAAIAHQVHGAMGFTREYALQQRTRRLWSWRDEFGAETVWAIELGRQVAATGADELWPEITAV